MAQGNKWIASYAKEIKDAETNPGSCEEIRLKAKIAILDEQIDVLKSPAAVTLPTIIFSLTAFFFSFITLFINLYNSKFPDWKIAQVIHGIWGEQAAAAINNLISIDQAMAAMKEMNGDYIIWALIITGICLAAVGGVIVGIVIFDKNKKGRRLEECMLARTACQWRLEELGKPSNSNELANPEESSTLECGAASSN